jgi:alkylation response protein AidB-like acyl-CoA dehydrogenase
MSDTGSMIGDAVERMLAASAAHGAAGEALDADAWRTLVEAGVPRLLRPEAQGGAGDAFRDAAAVLRAAGRHGTSVPLADALVGHALLARGGIEADDSPLRLVVDGPDGAPDPQSGAPAGWHVLVLAPWGDAARCDWRDANGAATRSFLIDDAPLVRGLLAVAGAAVLTGAMQRALEQSIEWAGVRRQFGRPIGAFQAVQHGLAVAAEELAASHAALDWAAAALQDGRAMPAPAVAKARAAEAAGKVAAVVHQVHGAIGFTAEHPLHRSTRLLWRWRDRWGDESHWCGVLGREALAAGPDGLFDLVIGDPRD